MDAAEAVKPARAHREHNLSLIHISVYNKLVRRSLVEEHSLRFVVGLKEGEDLAFLLMLLSLIHI